MHDFKIAGENLCAIIKIAGKTILKIAGEVLCTIPNCS